MSLPMDAANILIFLTGAQSPDDFLLRRGPAGIVVEKWNHAQPQPTEQEIIDASNDLTEVRGKRFSEWRNEHGADLAKTIRREASESIDLLSKRDMILRAALLVVMDEMNTLRAQHGLAPRTATELRNAIKGKISAGQADS